MKKLILILLFTPKAIFLAGQYGTLDEKFGDRGMVLGRYGNPPVSTRGRGMCLQKDGKILLASTVEDTVAQLAVFRYLPDGSLDHNFGVNGTAFTLDKKRQFSGTNVAQLPSGKVILCGVDISTDSITCDIVLARFLTNGAPDLSFGLNGMAIHRLWPTRNNAFTLDIKIQVDEKILVAGMWIDPTFRTRPFIARFLSEGMLDRSFADNGVMSYIPGYEYFDGYVSQITLTDDNKIIAAGAALSLNKIGQGFLTQLQTNGKPDISFGSQGTVLFTAYNRDTYFTSLLIQPDRRIIATSWYNGELRPQIAVSRFYPTGVIDKTFGEEGSVSLSYSYFRYSGAYVKMQADHKLIVVAGGHLRNDGEFLVTRLQPDGDFDQTWGDGGIVFMECDNGQSSWIPVDAVIQPDHKIVVAGNSFIAGPYYNMLVRYNSNYEISASDSLEWNNVLQIYPNPGYEKVTLKMGSSEERLVNIDLYGCDGRFIKSLSDKKKILAGVQTEVIDISDLYDGVYVVKILINNKTKTLKVVKMSVD